MQDVKDLLVWQKGIELCKSIYRATSDFPKTETYGLVSQMRRAIVAVPSNLAEGRARATRKDYRYFVIVARGSACELETQIIISQELGLLEEELAQTLLASTREIVRMLNGLVRSLSAVGPGSAT